MVSIPEFLEFFATPLHIRMAKSAAAAVRMSLDLLQLSADEEYLQQLGDEDGEEEQGEEGLGGEGSAADANEDADLKAKVNLKSFNGNIEAIELLA